MRKSGVVSPAGERPIPGTYPPKAPSFKRRGRHGTNKPINNHPSWGSLGSGLRPGFPLPSMVAAAGIGMCLPHE